MKNKNLFHYLSLLIGFLFLTNSCSTLQTEETTREMPTTFVESCASCHGEDLKGGIAQSLLDGSWQYGARKNDIFRSIKYGHPQYGMPAWGGVLAEEEIEELVAYLLAEEERLGVNRPSIPDSLQTLDYVVDVQVFVEGLETPWAVDFIDLNTALVTERAGRLRMISDGVLQSDSIQGIPEVAEGGQGGLLDVAIDPDYKNNGWIYLSYSHGLPVEDAEEKQPRMTKIVRGRIQDNAWVDQQVLFEATHESYRTTRHHYGSRIVFDPQGYLFFSIGDRGASDHAQDLSKPNGKIHRIQRDGSIPPSNPFYGQDDAVQSIFSYGHRNPQGLAVHPITGRVWETEHGPLGGDELNLIAAGLNYGWPVITYGLNYNGTIISEDFIKEGMEQPIIYWKPSIAACGLDFYDGDLFAKWKNRLLVGALKHEEVQLLDVVDDRVIYQQTILKNAGRVRDVTSGPDGAIYVVLNRPDVIIRLTPIQPLLS